MYSAATIKWIILSTALTAVVSVAAISCGGNTSKDTDAAQSMLDEVKQLRESRLYDSAASVADSLCRKFPKEFDIVREAMNLKATILAESFTQQLTAADSVIAANAPVVQALAGNFKVVKTNDMVEGYRVPKSVAGTQLINRTAIEPRIDDGGNLYIVSLLNGRSIQHTKLVVSAGSAGSAETASIPYDKARNYRFSDDGVSNEMVTFHFDECSDFCQFICDNIDKNLTLTFSGKSTYSIPLSATLKRAIADSYKYSAAIHAGLDAEKQKLILNRKLEIAKRQIEKTNPDSVPAK